MKLVINSCGWTKCPKAWEWDTSKTPFDDYDLWIVMSGKGTMRTVDKVYTITQGDCFLLSSAIRYIAKHDKENPLEVVHIHFNGFSKVEALVDVFHRRLKDWAFIESLLVRLFQSEDKYLIQDKEVNPWFKALLLEILQQDHLEATNKAGTIEDDALGDIIKLINQDISKHYKVKALAKRAGYSHDHFTKLFKSVYGVTPENYMINQRMVAAKNLLRESSMTIEAISKELGYNNRFYFSKQFKNLSGSSPSKYRSDY